MYFSLKLIDHIVEERLGWQVAWQNAVPESRREPDGETFSLEQQGATDTEAEGAVGGDQAFETELRKGTKFSWSWAEFLDLNP